MDFFPPPTSELYSTYQDLLFAVNKLAFNEGYGVTTRRLKKITKGKLRKVWRQYDKEKTYDAQGLEKKEMSPGLDRCSIELIASRDNESFQLSFSIHCYSHNQPPTPSGVYFTNQKMACK